MKSSPLHSLNSFAVRTYGLLKSAYVFIALAIVAITVSFTDTVLCGFDCGPLLIVLLIVAIGVERAFAIRTAAAE
jgi:hypothetical protein